MNTAGMKDTVNARAMPSVSWLIGVASASAMVMASNCRNNRSTMAPLNAVTMDTSLNHASRSRRRSTPRATTQAPTENPNRKPARISAKAWEVDSP